MPSATIGRYIVDCYVRPSYYLVQPDEPFGWSVGIVVGPFFSIGLDYDRLWREHGDPAIEPERYSGVGLKIGGFTAYLTIG